MDPTKLILLAIAILGGILVALLLYLLVIAPRGKSKTADGQVHGSERPVPLEETARQPVTHVPGMDSVNEHVPRRSASSLEHAGPTDVTPPAGISRSDLRDLLTDRSDRRGSGTDDLTPPGGMDSLAAPRPLDRDTAPQDTLAKPDAPAPPSDAGSPGAAARDAAPPRKRTVALDSTFFDDDERPADPIPGPRLSAPTPTLAPPRPSAPPSQRPAARPTAPPPLARPAPATPAPERPAPSSSVPSPTAPRESAPSVTAPAAADQRPERKAESPPAVTPSPRTAPSTSVDAPAAPVRDVFASPSPSEPFFDDVDAPTEQLRAPESLDERFRDRSLPAEYRVEALTQLLRQGGPDERLLLTVEAINDNLKEIQLIALNEISENPSDTLLDEVIPFIEDDSPDVALAAVQALSSIGGPVVEQALLASVESPHESVQTYAIQALVSNATPDLEEQLQEMVNEDDEHQVEIAARLLARIGGAQSAEVLEVRASLTPSSSPLQAQLQRAAAEARTIERAPTRPEADNDNPFGSAESFESAGSGLEEFELSLDPELFNPKG